MNFPPDDNVNPFELFGEWYAQALKLDRDEPSNMVLASVAANGRPSTRVVLLRHFDEQGFCFFTNLTSRKGKELIANPAASLCFYWDELGLQVRIDGDAERVSEKEADDYYASRARGSQIGAWASKQSHVMEESNQLVERVKQITQQFEGQQIPRPPFWSGFRVVPHTIEFWKKAEFRLHTRIQFTKVSGKWITDRLFP